VDGASLSAPFVEGLRRGEIWYQACNACGTSQSLARYACCRCGRPSLEWRRAMGRGTVYATSVVARAPSEAFRALAPYTLVIVELDEGARLMAHAVPGVAIGQRVSATFFEFAGNALIRFEPAVDSPPEVVHDEQ
jgi:uncharacterized OB-fold protein